MAAQPKHRLRTRTKKRRAQWNIKKVGLASVPVVKCTQCGENTPGHKACVKCGYYKNMLIKATKARVKKVS